jgi:hypothetical protein
MGEHTSSSKQKIDELNLFLLFACLRLLNGDPLQPFADSGNYIPVT